ncbi:MAG: type I restriction endonuclease subunit R [Lachnospiraceae bacterium]|nr:type I restriction endonuclease subunit R [Lachnospiraceae bacterium]
MAELEAIIEHRLIEQLTSGDSQWTYRPDIRCEDELWANFKYILEQNNKAVLNDIPLSDTEFAKIKNDLSHTTFYDAGKWLAGENGKVLVHVQRGNETLHLMVMNNEHIAGGSSVYEVINQYNAFKEEDDEQGRNRRFDVTLLINGIPLIHIELKNKDHSYMDGFYQIKKYIAEGKFRGIFSNVQMFVVSNEVDTRYFASARDTELNKKFITGWIDHENKPVGNYLDFAKSVLKIPEAHEMVTRYTVLDKDAKKLLILRPYQIHAIDAMRKASRSGESGFIWHTTGSGKTMTSYKATRNLLMDIPSIDKTVFLIDRKDLDTQTTMAFQSYADNDTIDVDNTDDVTALMNKLADKNRQMIVTTRQKLQIMITKRLKEDSPKYETIKSKRLAFVVDECHRAVSPETKRLIESFFRSSLWYGFTGTPIFEENGYEARGDLPQTTEQLYGRCLHSYTIKEAIHDEAVLGFMVENLGTKENVDLDVYKTEEHRREVLNVILNKCYEKFGMKKGRGETYEAILTVSSIKIAQAYYELLDKIKKGEDKLKISDEVKKALPDFPKFAITYSVSENEESSQVNQDKMKQSLIEYNDMFDTKFTVERIQAYNSNLNKRLARKEDKYKKREEQLDLVIVVDRLLTGFDAPPISTVFIDRQPMKPQDIIQTFSRTNRLFDKMKRFGQIVTFQSPKEFKEEIDNALKLYSLGGDGQPLAEEWTSILEEFRIALKTLKALVPTSEDAAGLSLKQKKTFVELFRDLDKSFSHLKAFSEYTPDMLAEYNFSQEEYDDYAARYRNAVEEIKEEKTEETSEDDNPLVEDYDLVAIEKFTVDYEYIIGLIQGLTNLIPTEEDEQKEDYEEEFSKQMAAVRSMIADFSKDNKRLGDLLGAVVDDIEKDRYKYAGQDMSVLIHRMREDAIKKAAEEYASRWFVDVEDVMYEVMHFRNDEMANENNFKEKADYSAYKENTPEPVAKFKFRTALVHDFKEKLMEEIKPLL